MLVIFSTLQIAAEDRAWIDQIRSAHDPQAGIIAPHFTFVFPFPETAAVDAFAHMRAVARETPPIEFRLGQAAAARDPLAPGCHLFLLPTQGAERLHALHARLYSGVLAQHRHPTLPFAPHVTVGAFAHHGDAEAAAAALPPFDIGGALRSLTVARFDARALSEPREVALEG